MKTTATISKSIPSKAMASSCEGADCQGCPDCPETPLSEIFTQFKAADGPEREPLDCLLAMEATPERFRWALADHGIQVRYDVRGIRQQIRFPDDDDWADLVDGTASQVRELMASVPFPTRNRLGTIEGVGGVLDIKATLFNELMANACAYHQVDPLVEYIRSRPKWDGIPRLSAWLSYCFDVAEESEDLADWASEFVIIGAIARAMNPGVKLDEMPILIGKGGIGKSTALRYTLPPHLRYMFTDGLNLASNPKERVEALQGRAIVEAAEMQGARRADLESLKAFLSRTDDGSTRLAYRHNPEPMPRRCILVGTADRPDPLPDDPNLRRFVPITLKGGNVSTVMAYWEQCRDQLWAEGLFLYERGHGVRLPDELKYQQSVATESARSRDSVLEDAIESWLVSAPLHFTIETVALGIGLSEIGKAAKISRNDSTRIASELRRNGYAPATVRLEGRPVRRWTKV